MVSKKVTIIDPEGFHMRPASKFSGEMAKFKANITIEADGKTANGKSVMTLIASGFKGGTEVEVKCDGEDEQAMLDRACELIALGADM